MSETDATTRTRKRVRSPSYPAINLETALRRAGQLYAKEGRSAAGIDAILDDWGYSPGSGAGIVSVAALKKFGLLTDEGSGKQRTGKLSPLALEIIVGGEADSAEYDQLIREAALAPSIHRELWDKYEGRLPSDANLRHFLVLHKRFSESAAAELIKEFRETVAFAKLGPSDTLSDKNGDSDDSGTADDEDDGVVTATALETDTPELPSAPPPIQLRVQGRTVTLRESEPLTAQEWDKMIEVLKMMRPDA